MSAKTAQATTTLKLDTCSFSDTRMYPGRGTIFVSRDGKQHIFCNHKVSSLFHQRIKPAKLTWTQVSASCPPTQTIDSGMAESQQEGRRSYWHWQEENSSHRAGAKGHCRSFSRRSSEEEGRC
eukprot:Gregarina_sp_Pseudo_9__746@NODE_1479_length_1561_cov_208_127464_g1369_i0_p1_GENE_NODE_1479_length_1561_cov_208_127464_g1369_i0NODE_1479_length_1561_cov_208_127464_g1369_i0_p1_ORF_typecomplete_len123_score10_15Ribosomal_L24e/PF01246_20/1_4e18FAM194/PF14977_6/5_2FAM194/PF14977_6/12_NODE_1479_length_1561_cov_208_127464_g1369_i0104472